MSIVRVGLSETDGFSDGYDLIFGKKDKKKADDKSQPKEAAKPEEKKDEAKKS